MLFRYSTFVSKSVYRNSIITGLEAGCQKNPSSQYRPIAVKPEIRISFCFPHVDFFLIHTLRALKRPLRWTDRIHCNENSIYVFLFWELRGHSPNSTFMCLWAIYIFPRISPHICLQQNRQTDTGYIYKSLTDILYECSNWETEHYNSVLEITVSFLGIHK